MQKFVWKPEFDIGIDAIDREHQSLLEILNACHANPASCRLNYPHLKAYAGEHFVREEGLMETIGYPGLDRHRLSHRLFEERLADQEDAVAAGDWNAVMRLISFLQAWFLDHILDDDRRYARYVETHLSRAERAALLGDQVAGQT